MDEADRMIDMGFEEDVRTIFSFFQVSISFNIYKHYLKHCDYSNCTLSIYILGSETDIVVFSNYAKKNSKFCSISPS